jgi:hypothetical protein
MNKLRTVALFTAGIVTGAAPMQVLKVLGEAEAAATHVEVQNFSLARGVKYIVDDLPDGGHSSRKSSIWFGRACGYETNRDGGRIGEPCWDVLVDDTIAPVTAKLLDQKP